MWRIEWEKECEICKSPLNIRIKLEEDVEKVIKMILCTKVYGIELEENVCRENKCRYCYNKGWIGHKELMEREVRGIRVRRNKAWKEREFREWSEKVWRIMSDDTVNWEEFIGSKERIKMKEVEMYSGEYLVKFNEV